MSSRDFQPPPVECRQPVQAQRPSAATIAELAQRYAVRMRQAQEHMSPTPTPVRTPNAPRPRRYAVESPITSPSSSLGSSQMSHLPGHRSPRSSSSN